MKRTAQPTWVEQFFRSDRELTLPRRLLVPYLTTLSSDQFKVFFAVYCQWLLSDQPLNVRVRPDEIGELCDLPVSLIHRALNQLAQIGYLDVALASDLDGYRVTIPPPNRLRE